MGAFLPANGHILHGMQAQTNFYQYLPAIILVLAFLEGNAVLAPSYLYGLGIIITVARLSHVTQLFFGPETLPMGFRMAGTLTTFLFLLATSTLLILLGLQVRSSSPLPCDGVNSTPVYGRHQASHGPISYTQLKQL